MLAVLLMRELAAKVLGDHDHPAKKSIRAKRKLEILRKGGLAEGRRGCDRNPMWGMVSERDPAPSRSLVIFTLFVIVILRQIWIEIIK